jgi:hypothetical protein
MTTTTITAMQSADEKFYRDSTEWFNSVMNTFSLEDKKFWISSEFFVSSWRTSGSASTGFISFGRKQKSSRSLEFIIGLTRYDEKSGFTAWVIVDLIENGSVIQIHESSHEHRIAMIGRYLIRLIKEINMIEADPTYEINFEAFRRKGKGTYSASSKSIIKKS